MKQLLVALIVLLLAPVAAWADKTVTVKTSSGDYTTLNAALSGESADLSGVGILTIECYAKADTTAASTGTGYTNVDATHYINITSPSGQRHDGKWSASGYRLTTGTGDWYSLTISEDYTRVSFLQVSSAGTAVNTGVFVQAANVRVSHCIVANTANTGNERGIQFQSTADGAKCFNSVVYGYDNNSTSYGIVSFTDVVEVFNNTAAHCGYGFFSDWTEATRVWKNNLGHGNASGDFSGNVHTYNTVANNASSDATASGTGCRASQTFTFVDHDNNDFHLGAADAGAKDYGTSDPGSGLYSDDIDGVARSGSWDIGGDEYVAAGGAATPWPAFLQQQEIIP